MANTGEHFHPNTFPNGYATENCIFVNNYVCPEPVYYVVPDLDFLKKIYENNIPDVKKYTIFVLTTPTSICLENCFGETKIPGNMLASTPHPKNKHFCSMGDSITDMKKKFADYLKSHDMDYLKTNTRVYIMIWLSGEKENVPKFQNFIEVEIRTLRNLYTRYEVFEKGIDRVNCLSFENEDSRSCNAVMMVQENIVLASKYIYPRRYNGARRTISVNPRYEHNYTDTVGYMNVILKCDKIAIAKYEFINKALDFHIDGKICYNNINDHLKIVATMIDKCILQDEELYKNTTVVIDVAVVMVNMTTSENQMLSLEDLFDIR